MKKIGFNGAYTNTIETHTHTHILGFVARIFANICLVEETQTKTVGRWSPTLAYTHKTPVHLTANARNVNEKSFNLRHLRVCFKIPELFLQFAKFASYTMRHDGSGSRRNILALM